MIGFLGASVIVVMLIVFTLGSSGLAFLCLLGGKGTRAAAWLIVALVWTGLLVLTLGEVFK